MEERERKERVPFPFLSRSLPGTSLAACHVAQCYGFLWHLFNRVLGITESGFSRTRVLKLTDLVLRTTELGFSDSDWLLVQFSTLAYTVFLQAGKRIDTGAQFRDRANTQAPWTLGPRHSLKKGKRSANSSNTRPPKRQRCS